MGMKPQIKTKRERRPTPGICSAHMPSAVRMVFTIAMRACRMFAWFAGKAGARLKAALDNQHALVVQRERPPHPSAAVLQRPTCACSALPNRVANTSSEGATVL